MTDVVPMVPPPQDRSQERMYLGLMKSKETQIAALLPVLLILTFLKRRGLFVDFDSMFFCLRWEVKAVKAVVLFMVACRYHSAARMTY